jgi:amidase
MFITSDHYS